MEAYSRGGLRLSNQRFKDQSKNNDPIMNKPFAIKKLVRLLMRSTCKRIWK